MLRVNCTAPASVIVLRDSTQQLLVERLKEHGIKAVYQVEPTDGSIGKLIRYYLQNHDLGSISPKTMMLLFTADRAEHAESEIKKFLALGFWVICDRYLFSTMAYQDVPWDLVLRMSDHLPFPDWTFVFDVPVEMATQRRSARDGVPEMYEVDEFQQWVARRYHRIATACEFVKDSHSAEDGCFDGEDRLLRRFWSATTIGHVEPPYKVMTVDWYEPRTRTERTTDDIVDLIASKVLGGKDA